MTKKTDSTLLSTIDALLGQNQTVVITGFDIVLTPPTEAAVRKLRRVQYSFAIKDGKEPDMDKMADASLDLATASVLACIPGLDNERAFRLVLASGGEAGELVRAAMQLCGINVPAAQEIADDGKSDVPI